MIVTLTIAAVAAALFIPLFLLRGIGPFDFWCWMSANAVILLLLCTITDPSWRKSVLEDPRSRFWPKLGMGLLSAVALYAIFWAGNKTAPLIFDFAQGQIGDVYAFKTGASTLRISLLIGFLIGPTEELFWRAFLQRRFEGHWGPWKGLLAATALYTGIHISSLNLMLVLAAMVCGIFWGLLYMRYKSVLLNVVSHSVWDLAVFVIFPF